MYLLRFAPKDIVKECSYITDDTPYLESPSEVYSRPLKRKLETQNYRRSPYLQNRALLIGDIFRENSGLIMRCVIRNDTSLK